MKYPLIIVLTFVLATSLTGEEATPKNDNSVEIHKQVDLLMNQRKAEEAVPLLERALELNPDDTKALGSLGMIYTLMMGQPEKAKPLLEKGWQLDDMKCLQALAIAYIATNDHDGIKRHEEDFLNNFEKLNGSKIVCFFIAGQNLDEELFADLLKKVSNKEIRESESVSRMIAQTAKVLAEESD
jgi:tetratricopeptide (TPR) repeat protein